MSGQVQRFSFAALAQVTQNPETAQGTSPVNELQARCNEIVRTTLQKNHITETPKFGEGLVNHIDSIVKTDRVASTEEIKSAILDAVNYNEYKSLHALTQVGDVVEARPITPENLQAKNACAVEIVLNNGVGFRVGEEDLLERIANSEVQYFDENSNRVDEPERTLIDVAVSKEFMHDLHQAIHDRLLANRQNESNAQENKPSLNNDPSSKRNSNRSDDKSTPAVDEIKKKQEHVHEYNRKLIRALNAVQERKIEGLYLEMKSDVEDIHQTLDKKYALEKNDRISQERRFRS